MRSVCKIKLLVHTPYHITSQNRQNKETIELCRLLTHGRSTKKSMKMTKQANSEQVSRLNVLLLGCSQLGMKVHRENQGLNQGVNVCLVGPGLALDISDPCVFLSFQSHKDKIRQKERHKKSSDSLGSSVTVEKVWKAKAGWLVRCWTFWNWSFNCKNIWWHNLLVF